jgi:hypothetical protein
MTDTYNWQKIPSRAENKALKEALSGNDFDSPVSPPTSPHINRRPLDSRTEAQLHAACAAIVKGNPEDEPEAKLNFDSLHKTAGVQNAHHAPPPIKGRSQSTSHLPSVVAPSTRPHAQTSKVDTRLRSLAPQSRSAQDLALVSAYRRHEQQQAAAGSQEARRHPPRVDSHALNRPLTPVALSVSQMERPRTAPTESNDMSYATPKTASTDQQFAYASTAITSAAITPARISTQAANQFILDPESYQAAISEADTEAAVWMRSELERRAKHNQEADAPQPPPSRSSARGWSFRTELREYVRPLTSSGSRSASRDRGGSLSRNPSSTARSSSAQGWRSWGLQRKSSKSSFVEVQSIRAPSIRLPAEQVQQDYPAVQRKELDLNRELPPLPSIDTWQEAESAPNPGLHIASLIRSKSKGQSRKSTAIKHPVRSSSIRAIPQLQAAIVVPIPKHDSVQIDSKPKAPESSIARNAEPVRALDTTVKTQPATAAAGKNIGAGSNTEQVTSTTRKSMGAHSKTSSSDSCFSPSDSTSPGADRSLDLSRVTERMKNIETFQKSTGSLSYMRRPSDCTTAPPTRPMTRDGKTTNFSRKISVDNQGVVFDPRFPNIVEITALPQIPAKKQSFATLRKVLSKFDLKGGRTTTWMDKMEADGIKTGIIVHNDESPVTIIRY